jgi:hypothetical protein
LVWVEIPYCDDCTLFLLVSVTMQEIYTTIPVPLCRVHSAEVDSGIRRWYHFRRRSEIEIGLAVSVSIPSREDGYVPVKTDVEKKPLECVVNAERGLIKQQGQHQEVSQSRSHSASQACITSFSLEVALHFALQETRTYILGC